MVMFYSNSVYPKEQLVNCYFLFYRINTLETMVNVEFVATLTKDHVITRLAGNMPPDISPAITDRDRKLTSRLRSLSIIMDISSLKYVRTTM